MTSIEICQRRFGAWRHRGTMTIGSAVSILAGLLAAATVQAQPLPEVALHQPLTLLADAKTGTIRIDLAPQAWRVGNSRGPVANAAQLRMVLEAVTNITVVGPCVATQPSAGRCRAVLAEPDDAALGWATPDRLTVHGWVGAGGRAAAVPFERWRYFGLLQPQREAGATSALGQPTLLLRYRRPARELAWNGVDLTQATLVFSAPDPR